MVKAVRCQVFSVKEALCVKSSKLLSYRRLSLHSDGAGKIFFLIIVATEFVVGDVDTLRQVAIMEVCDERHL